MPPTPSPDALAAREALHRLRGHVGRLEEDLLAALVVLGEPGPQRAVDDLVDQLVDTLRAADESAQARAADLRGLLDRRDVLGASTPETDGLESEAVAMSRDARARSPFAGPR